MWFERVRALTLSLTRQRSVTNTEGETSFGPWLYDQLAEWPYFRTRPECLRLERTLDDRRERYTVFARVHGAGRRAVALCGHYDTVDVDGYADLEPYATDPEALLPRLIERLEREARSAADLRALADLRSGDYMAGRATLDMKGGLAVGLAVLERFAAQSQIEGNLVFVATPDEEDSSNGMRSAVRQLAELLPEWGIDLEAAINLDSGVGEGDDGKAVFLGSVGKVLPSVFFVGRPTHAGAPFDGVNAALLAAELTRRVEANPALGDPPGAAEEVAPPPVTLYQTDRRSRYDVTTPATAWCSYNVLTYTRTPADMLDMMLGETRAAMDAALRTLETRAAAYDRVAGAAVHAHAWTPQVLTWAQLEAQARSRGPAAIARMSALRHMLAADPSLDVIGLSQRLIEAAAREAGLAGPAAVLCFASQYYPQVDLGQGPRAKAFLAAITAGTAAIAASHSTRVRLRRHFPGISDMSFFAPQAAGAVEVVIANTPAWGSGLTHDYAAAARVGTPIANIGPWGHDYHQATERVNMPYSFEVLPALVWGVVNRLLSVRTP
ncbi:MAG TPA: M20/M25/M40 family metallo-hydrolase [Thermoflexales bacterium]|nr:M20/M25/M40 family metallo-hydrolase [Thermoflexales bacterium]